MRALRALSIPAAIMGVFLAGAVAHAQLARWEWWGADQATILPVSAANPLPVHCQ